MFLINTLNQLTLFKMYILKMTYQDYFQFLHTLHVTTLCGPKDIVTYRQKKYIHILSNFNMVDAEILQTVIGN